MTTVLLIRHANNDLVGKTIASWMPGVHLNEEGRVQANRLAGRLENVSLRAIYCSPLERALETAQPVARKLDLPVQIREELGEVRFGDWTGCTIADLDRTPLWQRFNAYRSGTRAPNGELMLESQVRIVNAMEAMRAAHPGECIAVVSHGDVIRAALVYYLGMAMDNFHRIEISPASITTLELNDWGVRVLALNDTGRY
jgi:probable phosphoglycerate mutase